MNGELPTCAHFGECGGCTALDVPIATQIARKVDAVRTQLAAFLGDVELARDVPARSPVHDRLKLLYPAQPGADRLLELGLYRRGSHALIRIARCAVQAEALTCLGQRIEAILRQRRIVPYDERSHTGTLRALHARIAAGSGELLVGLVTRTPELPAADALASAIVAAADDLPPATAAPVRLVGILHNVHAAPGNFLLGPTSHVLYGRDHLVDRAAGLEFQVGFGSFLQVHRAADELLYARALALLGDVRGLDVVDGYGGVGTFALRLAAAGARRVTLIESHPAACRDARANVQRNALPAVEVLEAPFAAVPLPRAAVTVVDPPRAGLGPAGCARLATQGAERVLYVSCSPASLARDLAHLAPHYAVTAARLVDLFPHTDHAEVVLLLRRRSTAPA